MATPFELTYEAPLGPVPDWLSYQINPTATLVLPYTVETLNAGGSPTAIVGQVTVTRYETQLLELPVTVSLPEGAEGGPNFNLRLGYTTAGGGDPTVARIYGGTQLVTLSPTRATPTSVATNRPSLDSTQSVPAASARSSAATATLGLLSSVQVSLSSLLSGATIASRSFIAPSLSNDLASLSSAMSSVSASPTSMATVMTNPPNASSSPTPSTSVAEGSAGFNPERLNSLTPSQLAAVIAAPICFFLLLVVLVLSCCLYARRRKRKRNQNKLESGEDDNIFEGGLAGGGGLNGSWGGIISSVTGSIGRAAAAGRGRGRRSHRVTSSGDWDWVEPRMVAGSRMGGYFSRSGSSLDGRTGTPRSGGLSEGLYDARHRAGEGRGEGGGGGISSLAGGGRYAHESKSNLGESYEELGPEDEEEGEIGNVVMREVGNRSKAQQAALGLGIESSPSSFGSRQGGPSLPERAASALNAGLRRISGGRLGEGEGNTASSPDSYDYSSVRVTDALDDYDYESEIQDEHAETLLQRARIVSRPPFWDPYRPSATTPQFPILAPVISATSSDEPIPRHGARGEPGTNSVNKSPDCEDVRRANLGLANLRNESRWSEGGSPRSDETNGYEDDDNDGDDDIESVSGAHDDVDHESTEMLASSREDGPRSKTTHFSTWQRNPSSQVVAEGDWLSGRPGPPTILLPPITGPPSNVSVSHYSQSDAGNAHQSRRLDQGSWLATPSRFDGGNRSRENSGGSAASVVSMGSLGSTGSFAGGGNDKRNLRELFFSAPRWLGTRNPNTFPTSTISPIIPSGMVGHIDSLTPPPSSSSASSFSSRYADAPISQPASSTTRASFHTPRLESDGQSPFLPRRDGSDELTSATIEDSPMVYSVGPTPDTRTTRRAGKGIRERRGRTTVEGRRPDSEDILERAAKSYERERKIGNGEGKRRMIEEEWREIRLLEPESPTADQYDAPFSNLTPLSSPLLPAPVTPPLPVEPVASPRQQSS